MIVAHGPHVQNLDAVHMYKNINPRVGACIMHGDEASERVGYFNMVVSIQHKLLINMNTLLQFHACYAHTRTPVCTTSPCIIYRGA